MRRSKNRRQFFWLSGFSLFVLIFSFCLTEKNQPSLKLAHGLSPAHPVHKAMEFFSARVAQKSGGRLKVELYPSEQLGSERECLELLQMGSLEMTKVSTSVLENFVPTMGIFSLPYLFRDDEHRFKTLTSELGKSLLREGEKKGLLGLCYYDAGCRSFYTKNKPICEPSDLAGLKIRTQESPTSMKMVLALGGAPTPISWGELYSALQQGVVDGAENNPPSFYLSHHYEVCKFYSLDEHTAVPDVLLISTKSWSRLDHGLKRILEEAASESAEYQKELWQEATCQALEEVEKKGVRLIYPKKALFFEKVKPIYAAYQRNPEFARLVQKISEIR